MTGGYDPAVRTGSLRFCWTFAVFGFPFGCGEDEPPLSLGEATEATIAGILRSPDGRPIPDGTVTIGAADTRTDAAGLFRFPEQLPGRLVVHSQLLDWTIASNALAMETGFTTGARLVTAPLTFETWDLTAPIVLGGGDLTVTLPPGALVGGSTTGPATAEVATYRVVGPDLVVPGSRVWLRADQYEEPFDAFAMVNVPRPIQAEEVIDLAPGSGAALHYEVGAGWPHADRQDLGLYVFSVVTGYWLRAGPVEVVDGAIDVALNSLGWLAIGATATEFACVKGSVFHGSDPIHGAEVTVSETGRLGADRVYTDATGHFCANTLPGAQVSASVLGWGKQGDVLGTGAASGTGGGAGCVVDLAGCEDLGALNMLWVLDNDGDNFWPGQGDCDDADLTVNPIDSGDVCIDE